MQPTTNRNAITHPPSPTPPPIVAITIVVLCDTFLIGQDGCTPRVRLSVQRRSRLGGRTHHLPRVTTGLDTVRQVWPVRGTVVPWIEEASRCRTIRPCPRYRPPTMLVVMSRSTRKETHYFQSTRHENQIDVMSRPPMETASKKWSPWMLLILLTRSLLAMIGSLCFVALRLLLSVAHFKEDHCILCWI